MRRESELDAIDTVLTWWGRWARKRVAYLGYPSRSIEDTAGEGRRPRKSGLPPEREAAVEWAVERAVNVLPMTLRLVAIKEYADGRGQRRQRARDLRMGLGRYEEKLETLQASLWATLCTDHDLRPVLTELVDKSMDKR